MTDSTAFAVSSAPATQTGRTLSGPAVKLSIAEVPRAGWEALCAQTIEPNVFFDPGYATPAASLAAGGRGADALVAFDDPRRGLMLGLVPVVSAWQALRLPLPVLVAAQPYSPLSTPLLHRDHAIVAAGALIDGAAAAGAQVLMLPDMALNGAAAMAFTKAMTERGLTPWTDAAHERAVFDANTSDVENYLRAGMGAKRLKELRRLHNRLADDGTVALVTSSTPDTIATALERFLALEARGWKGERGTGLVQAAGDAAYIRTAATDLGARNGFQIVELTLDGRTIAAGLVLRQGDRAFFFKIAYDEAMGRVSPGVQLTLELTRGFAQDGAIALVDSTATAGHPMIDHIWRERLAIGDLLIPTRPGSAISAGLAHLIMARRRARQEAKRLVQFVKTIREKKS